MPASPSRTRLPALLAVSLVLALFGAPAAAAAGSPPGQPDDIGFGSGATELTPGEWVTRDATPQITARVTDRDRDSVRTTFTVSEGDEVVWQQTDSSTSTPGTAIVVVPEDVLVEAVVYTVVVVAEDATGLVSDPSDPVTVEVDTTDPAAAPGVRARRGQPARYLEGESRGGVGQGGAFVITNGGDDSVVRYRYGWYGDLFDDLPVRPGGKDGASVPLRFMPEDAGFHLLSVAGVDRAGHQGPVREYEFQVAWHEEVGQWRMGEGEGTRLEDRSGHGHDLTLSPTVTWDDEVYPWPVPWFDERDDLASSAGPVVGTKRSWTTVTHVWLDELRSGTVLSQTGTDASAFSVGYVRDDPLCPDPVDGRPRGCFQAAVTLSDEVGAEEVRLRSSRPVAAGEWYGLALTYDASRERLTFTTCDRFDAETTRAAAEHEPWRARGPLWLGRDLVDGRVVGGLRGAVGETRVMQGVVSEDFLREFC